MVKYIIINFPDRIRGTEEFKEASLMYLNQILKAYKIKNVINIESEYEDDYDLKVWYYERQRATEWDICKRIGRIFGVYAD